MALLNLLLSIVCSINTVCADTAIEKQITGRLVENIEPTANCGVIKVGVVYKFVIVNQNHETTDTIKVVITCPEGYGKKFFIKDKAYDLSINNNLGVLKDCYIMDKYLSQKLPTWVLKNITTHSR